MNIGLDFDGVISDCGKLHSQGSKKLYGVDIPPYKFNKETILGEKLLTADQYNELKNNIYSTRETGLPMEPVTEMLQYIPKLISEGHSILVVTSRNDEGVEIAKEWCAGQGLNLSFVGVGEGNSKAEAAAGLDVYVDDSIEKLKHLINVVPKLFLFSWGYNQQMDSGTIAKRIYSWEELYRTINGLQGK